MSRFILTVDKRGRMEIPKNLWDQILKLKRSKARSKSGQRKVVKKEIVRALKMAIKEGRGIIPDVGSTKNSRPTKK